MPGTVDESMIVEASLPSTVWMPFVVGYLSLPVLAGIVLTVRPLLVTTMVWAPTLTLLMWRSPIWKWTTRSATPHTPLPAATPVRLTRSTTFSPAGQYSLGRQRTSVSLNQFQAPSTSLDVST